MADLVPRCVVARSVALALSVLMQNRSERFSAVILECRSVEVNVGCIGMSLEEAQDIIWFNCRHVPPCSTGSRSLSSASFDLGSSYPAVLMLCIIDNFTVFGFHGIWLVSCIRGHCCSSSSVGAVLSNCTFVPIVVKGIKIVSVSMPNGLSLSKGLSHNGTLYFLI